MVIAWLDLETTGLEPKTGSILEIALVLTDNDLNILKQFQSVVMPLSQRGYEDMDDFVYEMHTKSGLLSEIYHGHHGDTDSGWGRVNPSGLVMGLKSRGELEAELVDWLLQCGGDRDEFSEKLKTTPLGGNSVHFDRAWIREHMPALEGLFSYRNFDMTSVNEMAKRWKPEVHAARPTAGRDPAHRALDDVLESIELAKYYRERLFR